MLLEKLIKENDYLINDSMNNTFDLMGVTVVI